MKILISLFLVLQSAPAVSEFDLYNQLVGASRSAERLKLGLQYEAKFPKSRFLGDAYSLIMDAYASQNSIEKMLEYGEKTIHAKPDDLHALVAVSRQLALNGRDLDRAAAYARHAIEVADRLKGTNAPAGYTKQGWAEFVATNRAAAEGTLKYIREIGMSVLRRNR